MMKDIEKCEHCGYMGRIILRTRHGGFCCRYCADQFYQAVKIGLNFGYNAQLEDGSGVLPAAAPKV